MMASHPGTDGRTKELWLIRHGETTYGAERRVAGWADPALTPRGEKEAEALRSVLDGNRFDTAWSSDLQRTIITSRLAYGPVVADERLREIGFGELEGTRYDDVATDEGRNLLEFRSFAAPGGESVEDVRHRVQGFVDALPDGRHLLFVHGGVIRVLTQDLGVDRFVATGSLVVVDWLERRLLRVHEPNPSEVFERTMTDRS
jgi:probable phosphoglycerate mutase